MIEAGRKHGDREVMAEKCCGREERGSGGFFMAAIRVRVRQYAAGDYLSLSRDFSFTPLVADWPAY